MKRLFAVPLVVLLTSCAHYNEPLKAPVDPAYGYRFANMETPARKDDTFVIVTFSGGGTRAAALAYGVLQKLGKTPIKGGNFRDAIDVVSSVSGGSYTAAYYALHGPAGLEDFRKKLLDQPGTQRSLALTALLPWNLLKLLSPRYSRIDHAADFFDRRVFGGKKYSDMRRDMPYTILNATEMDLGSRFEFTQEEFDVICSDLGNVRVAAAAAASSAFPVLLTPITFNNYSGTCGYVPGEWFTNAKNDLITNPRRYRFRSELAALMNKERRFIHLLDGGPADNIGLRAPYHALVSSDTLQMNDSVNGGPAGFSVQRMINNEEIKRVVVIVVNAKTASELAHDRKRKTPWIPAVLSNVSNTPMGNYSFESITTTMEWMNEMNKARAAAPELPEYHFVEVSFNMLPADEQAAFNALGTNYSLSRADVAKLIDAAGRILENSEAFQRVVSELKR